jgi:hypothetical protein
LRDRRDVEGLGVLAVDEVARPPKVREVAQVLLERGIVAHP